MQCFYPQVISWSKSIKTNTLLPTLILPSSLKLFQPVKKNEWAKSNLCITMRPLERETPMNVGKSSSILCPNICEHIIRNPIFITWSLEKLYLASSRSIDYTELGIIWGERESFCYLWKSSIHSDHMETDYDLCPIQKNVLQYLIGFVVICLYFMRKWPRKILCGTQRQFSQKWE